jgi:hypothetical protein
MSEWLQAPVDDLGVYSETGFDPDSNIDGGVPTEEPALPARR